ncbi:MAG: phosphotransferase [Alphaproteobacteria bacterium]|nr:phosphotransferase [Alphaproteobacteria bacterium]
MHLNPTFTSNIQNLYGETGAAWLNNLPSLLTQLSSKWNLRFLHVVPDLTYNFVCLIEIIPTGETAILKMGPGSTNIETEVRWLQCFNKGVPKVYWHDEEYDAFLMERLEPGKSLKALVKAGRDDTATRRICQAIRELHSHQQKQAAFTPISTFAGNLSVLKNHLDNRTVSKAEALFLELIADQTHDVLLHGDLHHGNILSSGASWKVIDPQGYVGDPVFEICSMIYCNCFPPDLSIPQVVERRLHILAEELPFDPQRIKAWAFCKTALSLAWNLEDHGTIPEFEVEVLSAIDQVKI